MKIKEVCVKTGLTEKAVRYYVENGLVTPEEYYQRGRTYREYSEEDIEALKNVSTLRLAGMSVESIKAADSGKAQDVMRDYLRDLGSEVMRKQRILNALEAADISRATDSAGLAALIGEALRAEPARLDFSRFDNAKQFEDDLNPFERRLYEREQSQKHGARIAFFVTAAMLFGSALALTTLFGMILFLATMLVMMGFGSGQLRLYRVLCIIAAAADGTAFVRSLGYLKKSGLLTQLISHGRMEPAAMPCLLYLIAAAALIVSLVLLFTNKPLTEYLKDS